MLSFARVLAFLAVVVAVFFAENSPSVLAAGGLRNINLGPDAKPSPDAKAAAKKQDGVEDKILFDYFRVSTPQEIRAQSFDGFGFLQF